MRRMSEEPGAAPEVDSAPLTVQALAARLEKQIVTGGRMPGERLVEDQLMAQFGTKRYAVRQALQLLQKQGLADRRPNAGAFVRTYTEKEVRDLFDLRELLESACAEAINTPVPEDKLAELRRAQQRHDDAVEGRDLRQAVVANIAFHQQLFGLSPNEVLVQAVNYYAKMSYAMRSVGFASGESLQRSREEHWQMIQFLEDSETGGLAQLCRAHLKPSRDTYLGFAALRSQM